MCHRSTFYPILALLLFRLHGNLVECSKIDEESVVPVPESCGLVMAESSMGPDSGFGVFSMTSREPGKPLSDGDIIIQIPDLSIYEANGMSLMIRSYLWDSTETGGHYEGKQVMSLIQGMGMLANGDGGIQSNILPGLRPQNDDAGLHLQSSSSLLSPGAGAISYYHNYTFFVSRPISAGDEVLINYGRNWVNERNAIINQSRKRKHRQDTEWLRQNAYCIDNLRAGESTIPHAGRGAFAARNMATGSIVAPVPLLPITKRKTLEMIRVTSRDGTQQMMKQLLYNYCFGNKNSSLLLFPYSPLVNLINHYKQIKLPDQTNSTSTSVLEGHQRPNVKLQWSKSHPLSKKTNQWLSLPLSNVKAQNSSGLLLELIALEDIKEGDEILLDYGKEWEQAWEKHIIEWQNAEQEREESYQPSFLMNKNSDYRILRTNKEQKQNPYPSNVFTSCYYRNNKKKEKLSQRPAKNDPQQQTSTFQWKKVSGIFEEKYLRPCTILQRNSMADIGVHGETTSTVANDENHFYTVMVHDHDGLTRHEKVLENKQFHVVTHVPRNALKFSDKTFTTDQHLVNSFRKEIGLPDHLIPDQWLDIE